MLSLSEYIYSTFKSVTMQAFQLVVFVENKWKEWKCSEMGGSKEGIWARFDASLENY